MELALTRSPHDQDSSTDALQRGFVHTLVDDVIAAYERLGRSDTAAHRREMIRTTFAAVEGIAWVYREHVGKAARDMGYVTPLLDLALRERSYIVSERGFLTEQTRFVSLTAMLRLTTRLAEKVSPSLKIDFQHPGWGALKETIAIRNRVTHPKTSSDLLISKADTGTAKSGFYWLLALAIEAMAASNEALSLFTGDFRVLLDDLKSGDSKALAEYRAEAAREPDF